jgi:hypothetical protein
MKVPTGNKSNQKSSKNIPIPIEYSHKLVRRAKNREIIIGLSIRPGVIQNLKRDNIPKKNCRYFL